MQGRHVPIPAAFALALATPAMARLHCQVERRCPGGPDCTPSDLEPYLDVRDTEAVVPIEGREPQTARVHRMGTGPRFNLGNGRTATGALTVGGGGAMQWLGAEDGRLVGYFGTCREDR